MTNIEADKELDEILDNILPQGTVINTELDEIDHNATEVLKHLRSVKLDEAKTALLAWRDKSQQSLYTRLASEAVEMPGFMFKEVAIDPVVAIPLTKLAELFGQTAPSKSNVGGDGED